MVISNIHDDYDIELSYGENVLKIVENHKHLWVTISSNNKWSKHIDYNKFSVEANIVSSKTKVSTT